MHQSFREGFEKIAITRGLVRKAMANRKADFFKAKNLKPDTPYTKDMWRIKQLEDMPAHLDKQTVHRPTKEIVGDMQTHMPNLKRKAMNAPAPIKSTAPVKAPGMQTANAT